MTEYRHSFEKFRLKQSQTENRCREKIYIYIVVRTESSSLLTKREDEKK